MIWKLKPVKVAWGWNHHSEYCAPSAKASRSNGPRFAPGLAVQKEEWDSLNYAIKHAHICVCVYMSVVHQPAIHEDQNASI